MNLKKIEIIFERWDAVLSEAVKSKQPEIRIVCPFIKHQAAKRLIHSGHHPKIRVITRFNLLDFCNGVSDTSALRLLLNEGAEIRGIRDLHAKAYLFGSARAIVTSANLTEAGLKKNHELGFVSEDSEINARCLDYFDDLWNVAGQNLTEELLQKWEAKLAAAAAAGIPPMRDTGLSDEGVDASESNVSLTLPPLVSEVEQSFVKFLGEGDNRESLDLPVYTEVLRSGCHWACGYPKGKRPRIVEDGAVLFMGRLVDDGDIMIFGRAIALAHVEGRDDATKADMSFTRGAINRKWKETWPHYIRVHHGEFVGGTLKNGVRLSELMSELKEQCFATTQENAVRGSGNVNPRRAYRRQAAVRLSNAGFDWLNSRLENAFRRHGKLTSTELESLDWPSVTL